MAEETQPAAQQQQVEPAAAATPAAADPLARQEFQVLAIAVVLPLMIGVTLAGLVFGAVQLVQGNLEGLIAFLVGLGVGGLSLRLLARLRLLA